MSITDIMILVVLLILSGFFSGIETALTTLNSIKVQAFVKQKKKGSLTLQRIKEDERSLLTAILIGNNLVNIGAASFATIVFTDLFGSKGIGVSTGVMTFLVLVFGEITPKTYAAKNAERISLIIAKPIEWLIKLLWPIIIILNWINHLTTKLLSSGEENDMSEEELSKVVTMGINQGVLDSGAGEMMHNIIEYQNIEAKEIMMGKNNIKMIDGNKSIEKVIDFIISNNFSRYPVYEKDDDNIIGVLDVRTVLQCLKKQELKTKVRSLVKEVIFIPKSKQVDDLLSEFEGKDIQMAMVVDEQGNLVGLVTMDDILEEIVGDIFHKSKKTSSFIKKTSETESIVDASIYIKALNETMGLGIHYDNSQTLAGYLIDKFQKIPQKGEKLELEAHTLEILKASKKHVESIKIIRK